MRIAMISRPTLFSSRGGDTVQIEETANELRKLGVFVKIYTANQEIKYEEYDLLHFFNIIRPNTIIPHIKKSKKPYLISTIYVDYEEVDRNLRGTKWKAVSYLMGKNRIEYLKILARKIRNGERIIDKYYLLRGHKRSVQFILENAMFVLPNSQSELERLQRDYRFSTVHKVVPNAVAEEFCINSKKSLARENIVLCIARIEVLKNQLSLIKAIKGKDIQLKIIGDVSPNHKLYYDECLKEADGKVEFTGYLNRKQIIEELQKAKVHVLPSWFETTGLSSLEAAALGCNIVVSERGDTKDYFDGYAEFCDPGDIKSIERAVDKALTKEFNYCFYDKINENYRWRKAAQITQMAYEESLLKLNVN